MTTAKLAIEITNEYPRLTQERISEKRNIPVKKVAQVTSMAGYKRRVLGLQKIMWSEEETAFLEQYCD